MPADRDLSIAFQTARVILEPRIDGTARAIARLAPRFTTTTADGSHVLAIAAHGDPALSSCLARLARIELVRGALGVSGLAALARDFALFAAIHRRKAAIASGST